MKKTDQELIDVVATHSVVDQAPPAGDFAESDEPFRLFEDWFRDAKEHEPNDPNAMALSTVDEDGLPNCRMVLLKGFDVSRV